MNKLTLSLVALATVGGTVQAQTTVMTEQEKADAISQKKATIDEIRKSLNAATATVSGCTDVADTYLLKLSNIAKEMNDIYNDDEVLEITTDQVNDFNMRIADAESAAITAQKPYTAKSELTNQYNTLKALLDEKLAIASKADYPQAGPGKVKALNALNIPDILETINGYDLSKQDIVNDQTDIEGKIKTATSKVNEILKDEQSLKELEDALTNNEDAHQKVVEAYNDAKAKYDAELAKALDALPSDNYKDWQEEVIADLNEQYRIITSAKNEDEKDYKAGTAAENANDRISAINDAAGEISTLVGNKVSAKNKQESANTHAINRVNICQAALDIIKEKMVNRDLTECDADIAKVQKMIDDLSAEIESQYKAHTIATYTVVTTTIENATIDISDGKGHNYDFIVKNYDTYKSWINGVADAQENLDKTVAEAKKASEDGEYIPADYFTATQKGIQDDIDALTKAIETAYTGKTVVANNDKFQKQLEAIEDDRAGYEIDTDDALQAYEAIQKTVSDQNALLAKMADAMKDDPKVTIDGTSNGKSYQTAYDERVKEVETINDKLDAAKKKADQKHLDAIKEAAAMGVSDDVQSLTESYADNKKAYDLNNAKATAEIYLAKAQELIESNKKALDGITVTEEVYGNQADAISTKKAEIQKIIADIETEYTKAKADYEAVADYSADKVNAAAKAVETLTNINDNLTKNVNPEVEELNTQATAAKENKAAYDAIYKKYNTVNAALADYSTKINDPEHPATGEAEKYYSNEFDKLTTSLSAVLDDAEKAYADIKAKDVQEELIAKIEDINKKGSDTANAIAPNEVAHNNQVAKAADLLATWQSTYDAISSGDLSDSAKDYLSQLANERENITAINKDIATAFGKGQSVVQDEEIEAKIQEISATIISIAQQSKDNYDANVAATNKAQHDAFIAAVTTTNTKFSNAVDVLNQFAGIKNEASKTAIENLLPTHEDIYAYADKIRQLRSSENKEYTSYANATYGDEDCIYSADEYIKTANDYTTKISALLKSYQDEVNTVAYTNFQSVVAAAEAALKEKQDTVNAYHYKGHKDAFQDVASVIAQAKAAGATASSQGIPVDPLYAVHVDTWAETLDKNLDSMLAADMVKACDAEVAYLSDVINTVHASETKEIKELTLTESDREKYLADIDELKENFDDMVKEDYDQTSELVEIIQGAYNFYFYVGTMDKHSWAYEEAVEKAKKNEANIEAYKYITHFLDTAQSDLEKVAADIKQLTVGHQDGQVCALVEYQQEIIDMYKINAEEWYATGSCVANEQSIKDYEAKWPTTIEIIQKYAIDDEIEVFHLGKFDEIKEEYNQVAKIDLDKVAGYDEQIQDLYNTLFTNGQASTETAQASIEYRWNNDKLTFQEALTELVAWEAKFAETLNKLNSLYDNTRTADAIAAVNAEIEKTDESIKQIEKMANYNEAMKADFGVSTTWIREILSSIQSDFEAKKSTILFYEEGLMNDLAKLNKIVEEELDENNVLCRLYDKHVKNDAAKATLDTEMEKLEALLTTTTEKISAFKYQSPYAKERLELLTVDINEEKKNIDKDYEHVLLVNTVEVFTDNINTLKNDLAEIDAIASYNETANTILVIGNELEDEVWTTIATSDYGADREAKLLTEYNRLTKAIDAAGDYNSNTYGGYKVYADIYGIEYLDEEGNPMSIEVDYLSEAYLAVVERIAELKEEIAQLKSDAETMSYIVGDADNDKQVTVNDYSTVRDFILNNKDFEDVSEAQRYAADIDQDGQFTVGDLNAVSNLIFGTNTSGRIRARVKAVAGENEITMTKQAEEVSVFGKTVKVAVNLNNSTAFTAGQFDIQLPDGMSIANQELSDRSNGHDIFVNEIGDGLYRVLVATIDNNEFNGNAGDLVTLNVEVGSSVTDGNIQLTNAIFADAQGRAYTLSDIDGASATGIDSINAATAKERVYSIGGQIMKTVKKGINIIVGENGEAKKVVKK